MSSSSADRLGARLEPARQVVGGFAHRAEFFAQRVDLGARRQSAPDRRPARRFQLLLRLRFGREPRKFDACARGRRPAPGARRRARPRRSRADPAKVFRVARRSAASWASIAWVRLARSRCASARPASSNSSRSRCSALSASARFCSAAFKRVGGDDRVAQFPVGGLIGVERDIEQPCRRSGAA